MAGLLDLLMLKRIGGYEFPVDAGDLPAMSGLTV